MPLTRHLYREDEVIAALMLCCLRGRIQEAAFWCLELLDSRMTTQLLDILRKTWLYGVGVKSLHWIVAFEAAAAEEALDPDEILRLVLNLAVAPKDASMLAFLGAPLPSAPDRVNAGKVCSGTAAPSSLADFASVALVQGKAMAAWMALRALSWEEGDRVLLKTLREKHGEAGEKIGRLLRGTEGDGTFGLWEARAMATAVGCLCPNDFKASLERQLRAIPSDVEASLQEWRSFTGRRARRVFAIPVDCLYWMTARGRELSVYESNEKEILGSLEKSTGIWNSEYWDEVAEEMGGWEAVRSNDTAREAFYEREFPDDIPDEWSKAERAKSHGSGVLQRGSRATAAEWIRRRFGQLTSAVLWGGVRTAIQTLEKRCSAAEGSEPTSLEELWNNVESQETLNPEGWNLKPVRRRILRPLGGATESQSPV